MRKISKRRQEQMDREAKRTAAYRSGTAKIILALRSVPVGTTINVREWAEENGLDWGLSEHALKNDLVRFRKRPRYRIDRQPLDHPSQEMIATRI